MATNTKFSIDLETGNFIVSSNENIYDENEFLKVVESYFFQSEWDFENNIIKFHMDNNDALHHLHDETSPFYKIANAAKNHHFSVMRYERI